jgi:hypothetical protein
MNLTAENELYGSYTVRIHPCYSFYHQLEALEMEHTISADRKLVVIGRFLADKIKTDHRMIYALERGQVKTSAFALRI